MRLFSFLLCLFTCLAPQSVWGQWANPVVTLDPNEVRLESTWDFPTNEVQSRMRAGEAWSSFRQEHPGWQVLFDQFTGTIHRAYGPGIPNSDPQAWLMEAMTSSGWSIQETPWNEVAMGKHVVHKAKQSFEGLKVMGTELTVKTGAGGIVMWGAQCFPDFTHEGFPLDVDQNELIVAATEGLELYALTVEVGSLCWVPKAVQLEEQKKIVLQPAMEIRVKGQDASGVPVDYRTLIHAGTGEVLLRQNEVRHLEKSHGDKPYGDKVKPRPMGPASLMQLISCQVTGTVHLTQPFESPVEVGLDHLQSVVNGSTLYTSNGGLLVLDEDIPSDLSLSLQGLWSTVQSSMATPELNVALEGDSVISFDDAANTRQLSAYHNVNRIHDHMQIWLPDFTGLNFSLPTEVDVNGTCNAFYTPGSPSINFYSEGDGCNAFSLVSDVVFHEYGHGINDLFYQSIGGNFGNGAMNEGYADFWAVSLSENPILGAGCYTDDPTFYIRRYDENPKVYPLDLVGETHADGEIICGAWYDTHLLMGGDWDNTMALFVSVFPGLQAETQNGNEGEAFVEVLLDVLQADDDDDDLSNGTPNGAAILEGFGMHGITLFSSVDIAHTSAEFIEDNTPILLEAEAPILFPFGQYFNSCDVYFRTSPFSSWEVLTMAPSTGDMFTAELPAQPAGTVVEYYFGISDTFGATSAISPYSANDAVNPNLPYNLIVGLAPVYTDDQDDYSEFGFWEMGLSSDNATTGVWESTIPVGSFGTPGDASSICAADQDHTPGDGLFAFVTGVSPGADAGIGSNDVDGGSTTLQSEAIDISDLASPVLSYWRWYVNAPASGANPGADWWQVHVSSDGGSSWVEIEETLTQDIRWRRNAFSIQDYVPLTEAFKIRFVASDSIRVGQELDGGSLIEAAVDDLVILDLASSGLGSETGRGGIMAWPVPASAQLFSAGWSPNSWVRLYDASGRLWAEKKTDALGQVQFNVAQCPSGQVIMTGTHRESEHFVKKALIQRD